MDAPTEEVVLLASQAVERRSAFKSLERTLLITRTHIVVAPFDRAKLRHVHDERTAEAKAHGLNRFQQMWYAAQAPFALIDSYPGMDHRRSTGRNACGTSPGVRRYRGDRLSCRCRTSTLQATLSGCSST